MGNAPGSDGDADGAEEFDLAGDAPQVLHEDEHVALQFHVPAEGCGPDAVVHGRRDLGAEPAPGFGAGADGELVADVERAGVYRDLGHFARCHANDEMVVRHVEQVRAGEVLAVCLDLGIIIGGVGERTDPFLDGEGRGRRGGGHWRSPDLASAGPDADGKHHQTCGRLDPDGYLRDVAPRAHPTEGRRSRLTRQPYRSDKVGNRAGGYIAAQDAQTWLRGLMAVTAPSTRAGLASRPRSGQLCSGCGAGDATPGPFGPHGNDGAPRSRSGYDGTTTGRPGCAAAVSCGSVARDRAPEDAACG